MSIEKEDKLGEGAYGIVYKGTMTEEDKITKVAIKRNYGDPENKGSSCLREMSFLALFHHPCITKLKNISVGDPFAKKCPMTPKPRRQEMVEDSHHFVMEFSDGDLADYYDNCSDYYDLKIVMCQILLGLEFIHSKGVLHRDLKPGNILVSMGEDKLPYAKICDFGLACHPSNYRPSTPGTVTYWYRAPEICCEYEHYSFPSDIWSMACIFYEIIKKKPLIITKDDNSKKVFKDIVNKVPHEMTATLINDFISKGDCGRFKHGFKSSNQRPTFEDYLASVDEEDFNDSGGGTKEEFISLLKKMMSIDPTKRPTATECLEDDFFEVFKDYKDNMYKEFPPRQEEIKTVKIIPCLERAWAVNILIKIYNQRQDIKWYNDHIIFHALRLYDDYLVYQYKHSKLRAKSAKGIGRLHTEHENSLRVYSCVYMMYKYFSTLYRIYTWDKIFPRFLAVEKNVQTIENFEKFYLKNICNYKLYGPTIIEYLDMDYKEKSGVMKDLDIMKYFVNYGSIDVEYEGTMEDLYLQIREGFKN